MWPWRASVLLVAACYAPTAPAGAPCQPDENSCPASQTCQLVGGSYVCVAGGADAALGGGDAPAGDMADASLDGPSATGDAPPSPFAFVQVNTTKPTAETTTLALLSPVTDHDAIIVCLNYPDDGSTLIGITDSQDSDYHVVVGPITGAGELHYIAIATNLHAGSDTIAVLLSGTVNGADLFALEYSGVALTHAFDATASMTGSATEMTSGSATTTAAPELVLGYAEAPSATAGSGFTQRAMVSGNLVEDRIAPTIGAVTATATTTAGTWTMIEATFLPE